jgi:hypothetical protein
VWTHGLSQPAATSIYVYSGWHAEPRVLVGHASRLRWGGGRTLVLRWAWDELQTRRCPPLAQRTAPSRPRYRRCEDWVSRVWGCHLQLTSRTRSRYQHRAHSLNANLKSCCVSVCFADLTECRNYLCIQRRMLPMRCRRQHRLKEEVGFAAGRRSFAIDPSDRRHQCMCRGALKADNPCSWTGHARPAFASASA